MDSRTIGPNRVDSTGELVYKLSSMRLSSTRGAWIISVLVISGHFKYAVSGLFPQMASDTAVDKAVMGPSCSTTANPRPCDRECPNGFVANFTQILIDPGAHALSSTPMPECAFGPLDRVNPLAHPPQFANDGNISTYWQSPENTPQVNFTLDLGIEHEIQRIFLNFVGPPPKAMIIFRSHDGVEWHAYHYFAFDCSSRFGLTAGQPPSVEMAACSASVVSASSLEFETLRYRMDGQLPYVENDILQRFTRARFLRFAMVDTFLERDAVDTFTGITYETFTFYMISEIAITARCSCNGHGSTCVTDEPSGELVCVCEHRTAGTNCERCEPLANAKPWARGISASQPNTCLECNCNGHADSCHYNSSADPFPNLRTGDNAGGICTNCRSNTAGPYCETCQQPYFYHNPSTPRNATESCLFCACSPHGRVDDGQCNVITGDCSCKLRTTGRDCGTCQDGYYGINSSNLDGCDNCACNAEGTINGSLVCEKNSGQCPCLPSTSGRKCDQCAANHFRAPNGLCSACNSLCGEAGCNGSGVQDCNDCRTALEDGVCVDECSPFHYIDNETSICTLCDQNCAGGCSGPGPQQCFECREFEYIGTCVRSCPGGTVGDADDVCRPCHPECVENCTGMEADNCVSCRNYFLDNGTCVQTCPGGTYLNASTRMCMQCHPQCDQQQSCSGFGNELCDRCANIVLRVNPDRCVDECDTTSYYLENTSCFPCDPECAGGCSGGGPANCTEGCRNAAIVNHLGGIQCAAQCPSGSTYEEPQSEGLLCHACHSTCNHTLGCTGPAASDCNECAGSTYNHRSICLDICPDGTFGNSTTKQCELCNPRCHTCTGGTEHDCTECLEFRVNSTCVSRCPTNTFVVRLNQSDGFVPIATGECRTCHSQCRDGCTGPSDTDCNNCTNILHRGRCLEYCPTGWFFETSSNTCQLCHHECAIGCRGPGPSVCGFDPERITCRNYRSGSTCVSSCRSDQFAIGLECFNCSSECNSETGCHGPLATNCRDCARLNITRLAQCVSSCPHGTWLNVSTCEECHPQCDGCSASGSDNCLACRNVRTSIGCAQECPHLHFANSDGRCTRCSTQCTDGCTGSSASDCVLPPLAQVQTLGSGCAQLRRGRTCVVQCDDELEWNEGGICHLCSELCVGGCTGGTAHECTRCRHLSNGGQCVSSCDPGQVANESTCVECDLTCSRTPTSASRVCHSVGPTGCSQCASARRGDTCVQRCDSAAEYNETDRRTGQAMCLRCHPECDNSAGCTGPDSSNCGACKNWISSEGACVGRCDLTSTFPDERSRTCLPCNALCASGSGCPLGPQADGCSVCAAVRNANGSCATHCDIGWYPEIETGSVTALGGVCARCNPQCAPEAGCFGPTSSHCGRCQGYMYRGRCISRCPAFTFVADNNTCVDCDENCRLGCFGAGPDYCTPAVNMTILLEANAADYGCRFLVSPLLAVREPGANPFDCVIACPVGRYPTDASICESCHASCDSQTGCSGPSSEVGENGCNECPQAYFLDTTVGRCTGCASECTGDGCTGPLSQHCLACRGVRAPDGQCYSNCNQWSGTHFENYTGNEVTCSECSPLCDGTSGCTGETSSSCRNCAGYRLEDGSCSNECVRGWAFRNHTSGTLECNRCSDLCAREGCTGPGPHECRRCLHVESSNGVCLLNCPVGQSPDPITMRCKCDSGYTDGDRCRICNSLCRANVCSGPAATQCDQCAVAAMRITGECVAQCPQNEIIQNTTSGAICSCSSGIYDANRTCVICSDFCQNGCTSAGPQGCIGGPRGCREAYYKGSCVHVCPPHYQVNEIKECTCTGYVDVNGTCRSCHAQCQGGCTGPEASQCVNCANFVSPNGDCTSECGIHEVPDESKVCQPCSTQCHEGCTLPDSATDCVGVRKCKGVLDGDRCSSECSRARNFIVDCSHETETIMCDGSVDQICVPDCPSQVPYHNDTRGILTGIALEPQLCVADCAELGKFLDVHGEHPMKCVSAEDTSSSTIESDSTSEVEVEIIIAIALALVGGLVLGYIALHRKKDSFDVTAVESTQVAHHRSSPKSSGTVKDTLGFTLPNRAVNNTVFEPPTPHLGGSSHTFNLPESSRL